MPRAALQLCGWLESAAMFTREVDPGSKLYRATIAVSSAFLQRPSLRLGVSTTVMKSDLNRVGLPVVWPPIFTERPIPDSDLGPRTKPV
jgi:hypothetical protein